MTPHRKLKISTIEMKSKFTVEGACEKSVREGGLPLIFNVACSSLGVHCKFTINN